MGSSSSGGWVAAAALTRQLDSGLLYHADAVTHDTQAAVRAFAAAGDDLPLALPLQVHDRQVYDGPQVGPHIHHLNIVVGQGRVHRLRMQPDQLTVSI